MRTTLLVSLLVLFVGCDTGAQELPSIDPDEGAAYAEDAAVLALRYQLVVERDSQTVALPADLVRELYEVLVRVRASEHGGLVEGVRSFPHDVPTDVFVTVDTSEAWVGAWRRGDVVTGYAPVDRVVGAFGLELDSYEEYRSIPYAFVLLRSTTRWNVVALARQLDAVPGVRSAEPNAVGGDGDDITAERDGRGWRLVFSRGSGDCWSGCIERTYWRFRVVGDAVEYLGSGDR